MMKPLSNPTIFPRPYGQAVPDHGACCASMSDLLTHAGFVVDERRNICVRFGTSYGGYPIMQVISFCPFCGFQFLAVSPYNKSLVEWPASMQKPKPAVDEASPGVP